MVFTLEDKERKSLQGYEHFDLYDKSVLILETFCFMWQKCA